MSSNTYSYLNEAPNDGPMFVTMHVDGQAVGIEVKHVRDVMREQNITPVPLAPLEVAGSLNLRGRIVTVIDLRKRLGLPERAAGTSCHFVVVEMRGELYSLVVDSVGDVLTADMSQMEKPPGNLASAWKDTASSVYKLNGALLLLLDVQTLLTLKS